MSEEVKPAGGSSIFYHSSTSTNDVLRQSAKKQLDSYADPWIVMFEGLQNALDAVEDNDVDKNIRITLDPENNEVAIADNGKGFPPDKLNFALGKGTKGDLNNPNIRGEHGVGIKMVILCSESFTLWSSKPNGKIFKAEFKDGYKFIEREETENIQDDISDSEIPDGFRTLVKYRFPKFSEELLRPISVKSIIKDEILVKYKGIQPHKAISKRDLFALFIENYFRKNCYTGDVNRLFDDVKPAQIEVVVKKDETATDYGDELKKFWSKPTQIIFPAKYWDPTEWFDNPSSKGFRLNNQLNTFNSALKTPNQLWVLKLTDINDIKKLLENPQLREKYPSGYFDPFITKKVRGIYMVIAPASKARYNIGEVMLGEPDQVIAADGVVTTNQIRTPKRGKNQNYLNNIHIVINVADRVNYGKQGVKNPMLLSTLYTFFEEAYVNKLVDLASSVAGKNPSSAPPSAPDFSIMKLPKILDKNISITRIPTLENTLIALTHELISLGKIKGLETYQLHSWDQYDGKAIVSFHDRIYNPTRDEDLHSIEYKVELMDLLDDFELGVKDLKDLQLMIVWNDTLKSSVDKYQIVDLEYSNYEKLNVSGVQSVLRDLVTGDEAPLLVVKRLVTFEE